RSAVMSAREKNWVTASVEDAWINCWFHSYRQPGLERLPPRLWERLRQECQRIYRDATGEDQATLVEVPVGYRLIPPGQLDRETIERCAKIADDLVPRGVLHHIGTRRRIAAAIRALGAEK
ncbi:hypothetical protein, partial [Mesorhizobium sp. Z1-4]|uniref:hypothetical protein n=1 Tax=Mesorhizobium sp. Z1-4 TaxID=2448478 RepID=UPI00197CBB32